MNQKDLSNNTRVNSPMKSHFYESGRIQKTYDCCMCDAKKCKGSFECKKKCVQVVSHSDYKDNEKMLAI